MIRLLRKIILLMAIVFVVIPTAQRLFANQQGLIAVALIVAGVVFMRRATRSVGL